MRIALALVFALLLLAGGSVLVSIRLFHTPGPLMAARDVMVPRGGLEAVEESLVSAGVIRQGLLFRVAAMATFADGPLHAGELRFPAGASVESVLEVLRHGRKVQHRVTLAEGLEASQIAEVMARQAGLLVGDLTVPDEGALLPETYEFDRGTSFAALASRARTAMAKALSEAWATRAVGLPLRSPEEAIILASIVEHEARLPAERPMIARVYLNRILAGMRLQADPTTAYGAGGGLGTLGRPLDRDDLDREGPYNTYAISGLPAGPICSPGLASLRAVLHPASGDALYFVADGTGGHVFSASLAAHSVNVARYRALINAERRLGSR